MIVIYEKGTNEFISMMPQVFDNGSLREAKVEELYPNDHQKYGYIIVEDSPKYHLNPTHWQFKLDKKGVPVGIEHKPTPKISLSTSAQDSDGDGMPELKADGSSTARIDIQLMDGIKPLKKEVDLKVSTTGGRLSQRMLSTNKSGAASVELQSTTETITITVTVSSEGLHSESITFELMP